MWVGICSLLSPVREPAGSPLLDELSSLSFSSELPTAYHPSPTRYTILYYSTYSTYGTYRHHPLPPLSLSLPPSLWSYRQRPNHLSGWHDHPRSRANFGGVSLPGRRDQPFRHLLTRASSLPPSPPLVPTCKSESCLPTHIRASGDGIDRVLVLVDSSRAVAVCTPASTEDHRDPPAR